MANRKRRNGGLDSTVLLHQLVLLREQDPSLS
ncbi:hypothetical protein, partial [Klebsiella pneumoniae]